MALFHCNFHSEVLGLACSMDVILPQAVGVKQPGVKTPAAGRKHRTLLLLHGLSDDHTIWQRRTSIERYAAPLNLAVIMPAVARSYYTDMVAGPRYWTFISEELPALARQFFPLSEAREDNFVAGLSMGGYGAFKLALRCPEKFAAAASLSGAVDIAAALGRADAGRQAEGRLVFGSPEDLIGSDNDLMHVADQLVRSAKPRPALYAWCGTGDHLYKDNLAFRDHAKRLKLDLAYEEGPGAHEWSCWDKQIQRVLEWLPLK